FRAQRKAGDMGVCINEARHDGLACHIDNRRIRAIDRGCGNRVYAPVLDQNIEADLQLSIPVENEIGVGKENIPHGLPRSIRRKAHCSAASIVWMTSKPSNSG